MSEVEVIPATFLHAAQMADEVRADDMREIKAVGYFSALEALNDSLASSTKAWTGLVDGEIVCMFGVCPRNLVMGEGSPWLISTDKIIRHQKIFLRRCKFFVDEMAHDYNQLINYVDARNGIAIRWLRWLGFDIEPAKLHGLLTVPFHRFTKRGV